MYKKFRIDDVPINQAFPILRERQIYELLAQRQRFFVDLIHRIERRH